MCKLNYYDLNQHYREVLYYCLCNSNCFSVISMLKKPYSNMQPIDEHIDFVRDYNEYLVDRIIGIKEWPGTKTKGSHNIMYIYNSREMRKLQINLPNLFSADKNDLPEDVCFYRNGKVWLSTVSHEEMAYISSVTKEDRAFFEKNGIRYYV